MVTLEDSHFPRRRERPRVLNEVDLRLQVQERSLKWRDVSSTDAAARSGSIEKTHGYSSLSCLRLTCCTAMITIARFVIVFDYGR